MGKRIVNPWETDKEGLCSLVLGGPVRYSERNVSHTIDLQRMHFIQEVCYDATTISV